MHEITTIFGELALLALLGVLVSLVLRKVNLPPVAGLLVAGAIAGPHGLSLVGGHHRIELLAEVGVVLLLFTIGLEFSISRLRTIAKTVLVGGTLQVGLTIVAVMGAAHLLGVPTGKAALIAFMFALSSTAIVLRALGERQEADAPHGRFIVGVLIFQDLVVIAMMLLVPVLAGSDGDDVAASLGIAFAKTVGVVAGALFIARVAMPRALNVVEGSRSRETFGLALLAVCLGTAWLTSHLGLSLALGAFLAGVVIADSEYAHRALEDTIPARDILTSVFFVSMGMLFNPRTVAEAPLTIALLLLAFVIGKGLIASVAALVMRFPARVAWLAGAALAQFGEFGFVLATAGERAGLISRIELAPILAAGLLSMFITRLVMAAAPRMKAGEALLRPLEKLLRVRGIDEPDAAHRKLDNHVIIAGYGPGGRALAKRLAERNVPHLILELNAQTLRTERERGAPIYYGDITSREARQHASVGGAAAIALLISDPDAAARAVVAIRGDGDRVPIFVRARRRSDAEHLLALGADHVVCEEDLASLQLADDVMTHVAAPPGGST